MAKSKNFTRSGKRTNRNLTRELHIIMTSRTLGDSEQNELWDELDSVEPIQRTSYDLSD